MQDSQATRIGRLSRHLRTWTLAATCGLGMALAGVGCDKLHESAERQADKDVANVLDQDVAKAREAGGEKAANKVMADLNKAAGQTAASASPLLKARAKYELATEEFGNAQKLMPELTRKELAIRSVVWDIGRSAARVSDAARSIASEAEYTTEPAIKQIKQEQEAIAKKAAEAKQQVAALKADEQKRKQEIDALTAEKAKATEEADTLAEKAGTIKDEAALKQFQDSTALREKAGVLASKIDLATVDLVPVQRSIAIAEAQIASYEASLKEFDQQAVMLKERWDNTQNQVATLSSVAKAAAGDPASARGDDDKRVSVADRGARLAGLLAEADQQRVVVEKLLTDAAKHFGEAAQSARQVKDQLTRRLNDPDAAKTAEAAAWRAIIQANNENSYRLRQGDAQLSLATLRAQQAATLAEWKGVVERQVTKAYADTGLTAAPTVAPADLDARLQAARKAAQDAYEAAMKTLEPVATSTFNFDDAAQKTAAQIDLALAYKGRGLLTGDDADLKRAEADLKKIKEDGGTLPPGL